MPLQQRMLNFPADSRQADGPRMKTGRRAGQGTCRIGPMALTGRTTPWMRVAVLALFHRQSVGRMHQLLTLRLDLFAQQPKFLPRVQFCDQQQVFNGNCLLATFRVKVKTLKPFCSKFRNLVSPTASFYIHPAHAPDHLKALVSQTCQLLPSHLTLPLSSPLLGHWRPSQSHPQASFVALLIPTRRIYRASAF